jgi:pimeloyl-ACP methyl ester carboxylesterase
LSEWRSRVDAVRVDGRVAALRRWPGSTPAVVLLHGAGGNHDTLAPLGDALAVRGAAVVAPSLPGRCGSDGPPCATAAEAAAWVAELCQVLELRAPIVAGHSYGGGVALEVGFGFADRIGGLALLATGARLRVHPTILQVMEEADRTGRPADAGRLAWRPHADPAIVDRAVAAAARTPPAAALQDWRAANAFDRMGQLHGLQLPTVVVGGTEDELTPPKYARYLAEHIAGARLRMLEGEGHMLPVEQAALVADAIAELRAELA